MESNNQKIEKVLLTSAHVLLEKGMKEGDAFRFMIPSGKGGWEGITWRTYLGKTARVARFLNRLGIGTGKKTAIFAKTMVEWAYAGMAIQACRAVLVPIYHTSTPGQARYILNHSDSEVLFTEVDLLPAVLQIWEEIPNVKKVVLMDLDVEEKLLRLLTEYAPLNAPNVSRKIISMKEICMTGDALTREELREFESLITEIKEDDISAILYTSGATGDPKGVMLSNWNFFINTSDWIGVLGSLIPQKKVDLMWLPASHIFGWGEIGLGNIFGFLTYLTNPKEVLGKMAEVKPTVFMSVPLYWEKLYEEAKAFSKKREEQLQRLITLTGGHLRFCLSGGAGLKKEVKEFFYDAGLLIIEGYGLTECSPTLTMNRKDDFDFDTVGRPFPTVTLKLAPDGEILAKGPNIFKGYYKDPVRTAQAFDEDGWFRTGDIGEWTERRFLKVKGRKKEIIVTSGGKNISPFPIESRFKDDPYIEQAVLYGDEKEYLVALITLKENAVKTYAGTEGLSYNSYEELIRHPAVYSLIKRSVDCANLDLAPFERIRRFHIHPRVLSTDDGFLTPSMKLRRIKVYEVFKNTLEGLYDDPA
jgi:long-chain acyl-CoA synthetase